MTLPPFLEEMAFGEIRIKGHRIALEHVVQLHRRGLSASEIHDYYPTLSVAMIENIVGFYKANQADVDGYVDVCEASVARDRASATRGPDLAELRRRMLATQASPRV